MRLRSGNPQDRPHIQIGAPFRPIIRSRSRLIACSKVLFPAYTQAGFWNVPDSAPESAKIATDSKWPDQAPAQAEQEVARLRHELALARDRLADLQHVIRDTSQIGLGVVSIVAGRWNTAEARLMAKDIRLRLGAIGLTVASSENGFVELSGCIEKLARESALVFGRQRIGQRLDLARVRVHERAAVSIALITVELLANAYQHAFVNRPFGSIEINLAPISDMQAMLSIADNGIGMAPEIEANWLRDVPGRSYAGLPTAAGLARNLGAQLNLKCDAGTTFDLLFPARP
jgi:two-component sensor histidine kinase